MRALVSQREMVRARSPRWLSTAGRLRPQRGVSGSAGLAEQESASSARDRARRGWAANQPQSRAGFPGCLTSSRIATRAAAAPSHNTPASPSTLTIRSVRSSSTATGDSAATLESSAGEVHGRSGKLPVVSMPRDCMCWVVVVLLALASGKSWPTTTFAPAAHLPRTGHRRGNPLRAAARWSGSQSCPRRAAPLGLARLKHRHRSSNTTAIGPLLGL